MSFNISYIAADLSYTPSEADLRKAVRFLSDRGIVGEAISKGTPTMGTNFSWRPGANAKDAAESYGYAFPAPDDTFNTIDVYMSTEPLLIGDDGGPAFSTRFYLCFVNAGEVQANFVQAISEVLGAALFTWIGHY